MYINKIDQRAGLNIGFKSDLNDWFFLLIFFLLLIWSFWIEYLLPIKYTIWKLHSLHSETERKYLERLEIRQHNSNLIFLLNKNNVNVFSVLQTVCSYVFTWNNVSVFSMQLIGLIKTTIDCYN